MLVIKNLLRRRIRTVLSILGIALGIAAIVAFHAIGRGFKSGINRFMRDSGAQLLVVNKTVQDPAFSRISAEDQAFLRTVPGVEHLSRGTFSIASPRGLRAGQGIVALLVFGRTPGDRLLEKYRGNLQGRLLSASDEIMLGSVAAEKLGLKPGDSLELFDRTFRVTGIYETGVSFETVGAVICNKVLQEELHIGDAIAMGFLYLEEGTDGNRVRDAIESAKPHLSAIRSDQFSDYYNQLEYIDWFVWVVSLVSVAVGGLGVLNTMLMSVSERTREIGTLRAVGWSRGRVLRLILSEGTLISVVGGLLGLAAGAAGAELLIRWAPQGFLDAEYTLLLFGQAFSVAVLLGFAGALYPALQASRLSPIEALKYE